MATEKKHDPIMRSIDMSAEAKRVWGPEYDAPVPEYEFSNGKVFKRRTEESAVYVTSPDFG